MGKQDKRIEALLGEMRKANAILEGSADDGGRKAAAIDGQHEIAKKLSAADEDRELNSIKAQREALAEEMKQARELMAGNRRASKAGVIGNVQPQIRQGNGATFKSTPVPISKAMKGVLANPKAYTPGDFLTGIMDAAGIGYDGHYDPFLTQQGKARLAAFTERADVPVMSTAYAKGSLGADGEFKATLGTTGATGGYVLPNNLVDSVIKPATQKAVYQQLVTTINGVSVRGVDQPYRTSAAQRATFIDWGTTKTNVNEAYGTYSANLGTIAIIYDIGKQYARFSSGAAEQDVMDEIVRGVTLGENYYVAVGAGTGGVGTGDPTAGFYTQLTAAGTPAAYTTSFTTPVSSTVIGSLAEALTQGSAALAARSRQATAWVVDATTYWTAIGQTAGTFGFILTPSTGPTGFTRTESGGLAFWGQPIYYDANLGTNATTKIAAGGEWNMLKLYRGIEFRIDTTDIAGTRWDQNLIGFRGEEEIGFHAGSAVAVGAMQLITTIIP
jgi:HK97 family phage major capsid protein